MNDNVIITKHAKKRFAERAGVPINGKNGQRSPLSRKLDKAMQIGDIIQNDANNLRIKLNEFVFVFVKEAQRLVLVTVEKNASERYAYFKSGKMSMMHHKHQFDLAA
jgi:hypothetical protein